MRRWPAPLDDFDLIELETPILFEAARLVGQVQKRRRMTDKPRSLG
jgi:hypothetical protein